MTELSKEDRERIYFALCKSANYMETGDPSVSAFDVEAMRLCVHTGKIRALSTNQMKES